MSLAAVTKAPRGRVPPRGARPKNPKSTRHRKTKTIHDKARTLAAERGISIQAAYSELGRIGAAHRQTQGRQQAASRIAPIQRPGRPGVRLWWRNE